MGHSQSTFAVLNETNAPLHVFVMGVARHGGTRINLTSAHVVTVPPNTLVELYGQPAALADVELSVSSSGIPPVACGPPAVCVHMGSREEHVCVRMSPQLGGAAPVGTVLRRPGAGSWYGCFPDLRLGVCGAPVPIRLPWVLQSVGVMGTIYMVACSFPGTRSSGNAVSPVSVLSHTCVPHPDGDMHCTMHYSIPP